MTQQTAREAALAALLKIEQDEGYSHLLIHRTVEANRLSARDRALLTRLVYGTVQYRNTLDFYLRPFLKKEPQRWVKVLLRLAVYQMAYLDKIPDHAVLHETVAIAKRRGRQKIAGFVNGVLRSIQRRGLPRLDTIRDPIERLAAETSHPPWLLKRWLRQYDHETVRHICRANNTLPTVTARVNVMKATTERVLSRLNEEGIEAERGHLVTEALTIPSGTVHHSMSYEAGLLTVQDESSMLVAHALGITSGMHVLDACAAPGGKTTHIAEMMKDAGHITALDLHEHKIKQIKAQAKRLGLTNVKAEALDSRTAGERFSRDRFDRILVDAPCSGFGVIRRKPDIKWRKSEADVHMLAGVQADILQAMAPLLKPGGKLVYSTCTIERDENDGVIDLFLQKNNDFSLDGTLQNRLPRALRDSSRFRKGRIQILPHDFGTDGFYIAVLQKEEMG